MRIIHTKQHRNLHGQQNEIDISKPAAIEEIRKDIQLGNGVLFKPTFEERNALLSLVTYMQMILVFLCLYQQ